MNENDPIDPRYSTALSLVGSEDTVLPQPGETVPAPGSLYDVVVREGSGEGSPWPGESAVPDNDELEQASTFLRDRRAAGDRWDESGSRLFTADGNLSAIRIMGGPLMTRDDLLQSEAGRELIFVEQKRRYNRRERTFLDALTDVSLSDLPFVGMAAEVGGSFAWASDVRDALKKQAAGGTLTADEAVKLQLYQSESESRSGGGIGAMVGDIVRKAPSFVAEFWGFGQLAGAVRTGLTRATVRRASSLGAEAASRSLAVYGADSAAKTVATELADAGLSDLALKAAGSAATAAEKAKAVAGLGEEALGKLSGDIATSLRPFVEKTLGAGSPYLGDLAPVDGLVDAVARNLAGAAVKNSAAVLSNPTATGRAFGYMSRAAKRHLASAVLDWGTWGESPTTVMTGLQNSAARAAFDAVMELGPDAAVRGVMTYGGVAAARPLIAAATGVDGGFTSSSELSLLSTAVRSGDEKLARMSGAIAFGMDLLEYVSENAGKGFSSAFRSAGLALGLSGKAAKAFSGEAGGLLVRESAADAGNVLGNLIRRSVGSYEDFAERLAGDQVPAILAFAKANGLRATEAEARAFLVGRSANVFADKAMSAAAAAEGPDKFLSKAVRALYDKTLEDRQYRSFLVYGLADYMARHRIDGDKIAQVFKSAGYDGFFEEMLEERYNDFAKGLLGLDDKKAHSFLGNLRQAVANVTTELGDDQHTWWEQLIAEAVGFSVPLLTRSLAMTAARNIENASEQRRATSFARAFGALNRGLDLHEMSARSYYGGMTSAAAAEQTRIDKANKDYDDAAAATAAAGVTGQASEDYLRKKAAERDEIVRQATERKKAIEDYRDRTLKANGISDIASDVAKNLSLFAIDPAAINRGDTRRTTVYTAKQLDAVASAQDALFADAAYIGKVLYRSAGSGRLAGKLVRITAAVMCGDPSLAMADAGHWNLVDEGFPPSLAYQLKNAYASHVVKARDAILKERSAVIAQGGELADGHSYEVPSMDDIHSRIESDGNYAKEARTLMKSYLASKSTRLLRRTMVADRVAESLATKEGWEFNPTDGTLSRDGETIRLSDYREYKSASETDEDRTDRTRRFDEMCDKVSVAALAQALGEGVSVRDDGNAILSYVNAPVHGEDADLIAQALAAKIAGMSGSITGHRLTEEASIDDAMREMAVNAPAESVAYIVREFRPGDGDWWKRCSDTDIQRVADAIGYYVDGSEEAAQARKREIAGLCRLLAKSSGDDSVRHYTMPVDVDQALYDRPYVHIAAYRAGDRWRIIGSTAKLAASAAGDKSLAGLVSLTGSIDDIEAKLSGLGFQRVSGDTKLVPFSYIVSDDAALMLKKLGHAADHVSGQARTDGSGNVSYDFVHPRFRPGMSAAAAAAEDNRLRVLSELYSQNGDRLEGYNWDGMPVDDAAYERTMLDRLARCKAAFEQRDGAKGYRTDIDRRLELLGVELPSKPSTLMIGANAGMYRIGVTKWSSRSRSAVRYVSVDYSAGMSATSGICLSLIERGIAARLMPLGFGRASDYFTQVARRFTADVRAVAESRLVSTGITADMSDRLRSMIAAVLSPQRATSHGQVALLAAVYAAGQAERAARTGRTVSRHDGAMLEIAPAVRELPSFIEFVGLVDYALGGDGFSRLVTAARLGAKGAKGAPLLKTGLADLVDMLDACVGGPAKSAPFKPAGMSYDRFVESVERAIVVNANERPSDTARKPSRGTRASSAGDFATMIREALAASKIGEIAPGETADEADAAMEQRLRAFFRRLGEASKTKPVPGGPAALAPELMLSAENVLGTFRASVELRENELADLRAKLAEVSADTAAAEADRKARERELSDKIEDRNKEIAQLRKNFVGLAVERVKALRAAGRDRDADEYLRGLSGAVGSGTSDQVKAALDAGDAKPVAPADARQDQPDGNDPQDGNDPLAGGDDLVDNGDGFRFIAMDPEDGLGSSISTVETDANGFPVLETHAYSEAGTTALDENARRYAGNILRQLASARGIPAGDREALVGMLGSLTSWRLPAESVTAVVDEAIASNAAGRSAESDSVDAGYNDGADDENHSANNSFAGDLDAAALDNDVLKSFLQVAALVSPEQAGNLQGFIESLRRNSELLRDQKLLSDGSADFLYRLLNPRASTTEDNFPDREAAFNRLVASLSDDTAIDRLLDELVKDNGDGSYDFTSAKLATFLLYLRSLTKASRASFLDLVCCTVQAGTMNVKDAGGTLVASVADAGMHGVSESTIVGSFSRLVALGSGDILDLVGKARAAALEAARKYGGDKTPLAEKARECVVKPLSILLGREAPILQALDSPLLYEGIVRRMSSDSAPVRKQADTFASQINRGASPSDFTGRLPPLVADALSAATEIAQSLRSLTVKGGSSPSQVLRLRAARMDAVNRVVAASLSAGHVGDASSPAKSLHATGPWFYAMNAYAIGLPETVTRANVIKERSSKTDTKMAVSLRGLPPLLQAMVDRSADARNSFAAMAMAAWKSSRSYQRFLADEAKRAAAAKAGNAALAAARVKAADLRRKAEEARALADEVGRVAAAVKDNDAWIANVLGNARYEDLVAANPDAAFAALETLERLGHPRTGALAEKYVMWRLALARVALERRADGSDEPPMLAGRKWRSPGGTIYEASKPLVPLQPDGLADLATLFDGHESIVVFDTETHGLYAGSVKDGNGNEIPEKSGSVVQISARRYVRRGGRIQEVVVRDDGTYELQDVQTDSEGRPVLANPASAGGFSVRMKPLNDQRMTDVVGPDGKTAASHTPSNERNDTEGVEGAEGLRRFVEFLAAFLDESGDPPLLVAHNGGFDLNMVAAEAAKLGRDDLSSYFASSDVLDLYLVALDRAGTDNPHTSDGRHQLGRLAERFGLLPKNSGTKFHDAMVDTNVTTMLLQRFYADRPDLARYLNLVPYRPEYGMPDPRAVTKAVLVPRTPFYDPAGGTNALDPSLTAYGRLDELLDQGPDGQFFALYGTAADAARVQDSLSAAEAAADAADAEVAKLGAPSVGTSAEDYFKTVVLPRCRQTMTWPDDAGTRLVLKNVDRDRDDKELVTACAEKFARDIQTIRLPASVAGRRSPTVLIPVYHADHSSGTVLQIPSSVFGAGSPAGIDLASRSGESALKTYGDIAKFASECLNLDVIGIDTKRSSTSCNESPGHSMRSFSEGKDGNRTWGENRFHVLVNLGRSYSDNDGFIGTELSYGYGMDAQRARAKDKGTGTLKLHLMNASGDVVTMDKGLVVDPVGSGFVDGSPLRVLHDYLKAFRKGTESRSTSTFVDRDAIKVGVLVNTTYGVPLEAPADASDGARAAAEALAKGRLDAGKAAHKTLFNYIYDRLAAYEADHPDVSGRISGDELDQILADGDDGKFWWLDSSGATPKFSRTTVGELLGSDKDPAAPASVMVNVVDGLWTTDADGRTHKAFDFSYVDNSVMSYAVANVSHDAEAGKMRFAKNTAIDAMTFASGIIDRDDAPGWMKDRAGQLLRAVSSWGVAAATAATDPASIAAHEDGEAIDELKGFNVNAGSEMIRNATAYNAFKAVRDAMKLPVKALYAPLVSCGAVLRNGQIIDHTPDDFLRHTHRGARVFGADNRRLYGRTRSFGYAQINCRNEGFRYASFIDGDEAATLDAIDRAVTALGVVHAGLPAAGGVERLWTEYREAQGFQAKVLAGMELAFTMYRDARRDTASAPAAADALSELLCNHHGGRIGSPLATNFRDLFDSSGRFDRSAIDFVPAPAGLSSKGRTVVMVGGSAFGLPRTPSYNGSMWLQVVRATVPVTEDVFDDKSFQCGHDAMVSPDAQSLAILGCDHDGDKSACYMLSGSVARSLDLDVLDPFAGQEPTSLESWSSGAQEKKAYLDRLERAGIVSRKRGLGVFMSRDAEDGMNDLVVTSLFDMCRTMPVTVDGVEPAQDRLLAGTDYARETKARPLSRRWDELKLRAIPAFDYLKDRSRGVSDPVVGARVGASADSADKARGSVVSLASTMNLCRMAGVFDDVFTYGGKAGKSDGWIKSIYMVDGISNATFDDIKEQMCLKMGWTPGMMDVVFSDILMSKGYIPTTEDDMFDVLKEYLGSIYDADSGKYGHGMAMLLSADPSDAEFGTGLTVGDVFGHEVGGLSVGGEANVTVRGDRPLTHRLLHSIVGQIVFGTEYSGHTSAYRIVDSKFYLSTAADGGVTFDYGAAARAPNPRAKARAALARAIVDYANTPEVSARFGGDGAGKALAAFRRALCTGRGSNAYAGYAAWAVAQIERASDDADADAIAYAVATDLADTMYRADRLHAMRDFANTINCFGADPGNATKMGRRGRLFDQFFSVVGGGMENCPAHMHAILRRMLLANMCAYNAGDVQTRLGRVSLAANNVERNIVQFAKTATMRIQSAPAASRFALAALAANKIPDYDKMRLEGTFQTATYYLAALASMPKLGAEFGTDVMSGSCRDAESMMRAMARAESLVGDADGTLAAKPEAGRTNTLAFHRAVMSLVSALYAAAATSTRANRAMDAIFDFGDRPADMYDADGAKVVEPEAGGRATRRRLAFQFGNKTDESVRRGLAKMQSLMDATEDRLARVPASSVEGGPKCTSFVLSSENLATLVQELAASDLVDGHPPTSSAPSMSAAYEAARRAVGRAGSDDIDAVCAELARQPYGPKRLAIHDVAEAYLVLRAMDAEASGRGVDAVRITPSMLFSQYVPLYATTCSRVTPANPKSMSIVDHIPGLVARLTDMHTYLDSGVLDMQPGLPDGFRFFDIVSACDHSLALRSSAVDADGTPKHRVPPRNPDQSDVDGAVAQLESMTPVDASGNYDLGDLDVVRTRLAGSGGTLRDKSDRSHLLDVLNSGDFFSSAAEYIESRLGSSLQGPEATPDPEPPREVPGAEPSAKEPSAQEALDRQPEFVQQLADVFRVSGIAAWADVSAHGDEILIESRGSMAGAAARLFGLAAKNADGLAGAGQTGTRCVIHVKVGGTRQGEAKPYDVDDPYVAASFCNAFNAMLAERRHLGSRFRITPEDFRMLTRSEREALMARYVGERGPEGFTLRKPSWTLDERGLAVLAGEIRLGPVGDASKLNELYRTAFHEYYHQMIGFFTTMGALSDEDFDALKARFGDAPSGTGMRFDEEAAADAFADFVLNSGGKGAFRRAVSDYQRKAMSDQLANANGIVGRVIRVFSKLLDLVKAVLSRASVAFDYGPSAAARGDARMSVDRDMFALVLYGAPIMSRSAVKASGLSGRIKGDGEDRFTDAALVEAAREAATTADLRDQVTFANLFSAEHAAAVAAARSSAARAEDSAQDAEDAETAYRNAWALGELIQQSAWKKSEIGQKAKKFLEEKYGTVEAAAEAFAAMDLRKLEFDAAVYRNNSILDAMDKRVEKAGSGRFKDPLDGLFVSDAYSQSTTYKTQYNKFFTPDGKLRPAFANADGSAKEDVGRKYQVAHDALSAMMLSDQAHNAMMVQLKSMAPSAAAVCDSILKMAESRRSLQPRLAASKKEWRTGFAAVEAAEDAVAYSIPAADDDAVTDFGMGGDFTAASTPNQGAGIGANVAARLHEAMSRVSDSIDAAAEGAMASGSVGRGFTEIRSAAQIMLRRASGNRLAAAALRGEAASTQVDGIIEAALSGRTWTDRLENRLATQGLVASLARRTYLRGIVDTTNRVVRDRLAPEIAKALGVDLAELDERERGAVYKLLVTAAQVFRRDEANSRRRASVSGSAGKVRTGTSSADVVWSKNRTANLIAAAKASLHLPVSHSIASAERDIAAAAKELYDRMRAAGASEDDVRSDQTWQTCAILVEELRRLDAAADETAIFADSAAWADAVSRFFRNVGSGAVRTYDAGSLSYGKYCASKEGADDTVLAQRNREVYGLPSDAAKHDAESSLRAGLIEKAVNAAYVAAAQVKMAKTMGYAPGSVHHDSFVTEMPDFESFAEACNEIGAGGKQLLDDSPLVEPWNEPEFVASNLDEWLSGTVVRSFGGTPVRKLMMDTTAKLRSASTGVKNELALLAMNLGVNRGPGSKIYAITEDRTTHVWDGGEIKALKPGEAKARRGFHVYDGLLHPKESSESFTDDEYRTVDLFLKALNALFRGGRKIVTGVDKITFNTLSLSRATTHEETDPRTGRKYTVRRHEAVDKEYFSEENVAKRYGQFLKETGPEGPDSFRAMSAFDMALYKLDQQWHGEVRGPEGMNFRARFVDAVFDAMAEAHGKFGSPYGRERGQNTHADGTSGAEFNDFVIGRLAARGFVLQTAEDDGAKVDTGFKANGKPVMRRLATRCVVALDAREVVSMFKKSTAYAKLLVAGRTADELDADKILGRLRPVYMKYLAAIRESPWLTAGDTKYLNNFGTPLQSFVGHGVFMAKAVRAARDRRAEELMQLNRHEATFASIVNNASLAQRGVEDLSPAVLDMLHEYFNTPDVGAALRTALMRGDYAEGKDKARATGLVVDRLATYAAVEHAIYNRLCEVRLAKLEGRNIHDVTADEGAVGRMISSYERAALSGASLAGANGLTDEQMYQMNGVLPSSLTIGASMVASMQGINNSMYFRSSVIGMLTTPAPDGKPLYLANPSLTAVQDGGVPPAVWGAIARWWAPHVGIAYDARKSELENARAVYEAAMRQRESSHGLLFGHKYREMPRDDMDTASIDGLLCRADDSDDVDASAVSAWGASNGLLRFDGSEAYGYARHLFQTSRVIGRTAVTKRLNRFMSWSKSMSVACSFFFPIATKWESPTAAVGGLATMLSNLSPDAARSMSSAARAVQKLFTLGTKEGWIDENFLGFKDIVAMMDSDDPFIVDLISWAESLGITMSDRTSNPLEPNRGTVVTDVENFSSWVESHVGKTAADAVRGIFGTLVDRQSERAFTYAMNATKLAVAAQMALRLKHEAVRAGRAFDPVRDMKGIAEYIDSEVGGVNPLRYAWAHPEMRKGLGLLMFSWEWTRTAWEAAGGGILEDIMFGGHSVTKAQRRITMGRWARMVGEVMIGAPVLLQLVGKAIGLAFGVDDDDDKWFAWENEDKIGPFAANMTPLLKALARMDETVFGVVGGEENYEPSDEELSIFLSELLDDGTKHGYDQMALYDLHDIYLARLKARGVDVEGADESDLFPPKTDLQKDEYRKAAAAAWHKYGRLRGSQYYPHGRVATFKRNHPVLGAIVPVWTGSDKYNPYGMRKVYVRGGKQVHEVLSYFQNAPATLLSKQSLALQSLERLVLGLDLSAEVSGRYYNRENAAPDERLPLLKRLCDLSPFGDGIVGALAQPVMPFSFSSMAGYGSAGLLSMGLPVQMGESEYNLRRKLLKLETLRVEGIGNRYGGTSAAAMRESRAKAAENAARIAREAKAAGFGPLQVKSMQTYVKKELSASLVKELFRLLPKADSDRYAAEELAVLARKFAAADIDWRSASKRVMEDYRKLLATDPERRPGLMRRVREALQRATLDPFGTGTGLYRKDVEAAEADLRKNGADASKKSLRVYEMATGLEGR